MRVSALALFAAVASAKPYDLTLRADPISALIAGLPLTPILPIPGFNASSNGFAALGELYLNKAAQLYAQADGLARATAGINSTANATYHFDTTANLTRSLNALSDTFWTTAVDAEQKVCSIIQSINKQNFNGVTGTLSAGISAQIQVITNLVTVIRNLIATIQAQIETFSAAEQAVVGAAIQAILASVAASIGPVTVLSSGLQAVGVAALAEAVKSLQATVVALQTAGKVTWQFS